MFGPIYNFELRDGSEARLAPPRSDNLSPLVENGAMQSLSVTRYLGLQHALTLEDEREWFDKCRTDPSSIVWGIEHRRDEDGDWRFVGVSSLHKHENPGNMLEAGTATSGICIFDEDYWGLGLASAAHKARTWHAFKQLGLIRIASEVFAPNEGSSRAIESVGYYQTGIERNKRMHAGK